ncbi:Co2+/Mg2+ efflux protein ApaG [Candidatus Nitrosacidococcus tergens]|uniref:Protein ApaG n=1 Tax=Candidatus Nitrosacidococcus tergens TaxID=553981 RepID=A0A7G1Q9U0_9GAMM|nr:Co2+/Mg2+ efflux protein ApaG [Candidatus Nitrosacidococcus tergens]CAB1275983.1 protein associated with Co2+ and Mg2+ efflux [Candidatus Nitrosacidococcus tergens]
MEDSAYKVAVTAETFFVEEQSDPTDSRYIFAYTIKIRNLNTVAVTLLTRHWVITNGEGQIQEIHGQGVVGKQPYLKPGGEFCYTSGAMLETPVGTMQGSYCMVTEDGVAFEANIGIFSLAVPGCIH